MLCLQRLWQYSLCCTHSTQVDARLHVLRNCRRKVVGITLVAYILCAISITVRVCVDRYDIIVVVGCSDGGLTEQRTAFATRFYIERDKTMSDGAEPIS